MTTSRPITGGPAGYIVKTGDPKAGKNSDFGPHGKPCSAAEILVQQAEQQMVLPDPVDAEITAAQPLAGEAALLQHPDRRRIGGNAGGLDPVQIELAEQR